MTKGERIRELRMSKNISQTELADMIGQSKQTVYKYETNIVTNIPSDVVERIAIALGTTPSYIFGWSEKSEPVKTDPLSEFKLSAKQRELLEMLLTLDQETLGKTLDFARFLLSQRDKNE